MNNLLVNGIKDIEGMKFHDIEGGFGKDKKAMLVKDIAEIHRRDLKVINQSINMNRKRFNENIDIVDLKSVNQIDRDFLNKLGFSNSSIANANNIYLLSERGYSKLLKILEDDVAWEQYEKLVDGYFNMRSKEQKATCIEDVLISSLQEMKALKGEVQAIKVGIQETKEELQGVRDITGLSSVDWRNESKKLVVKIAQKLGGNQFITDIYKEIYTNLERRAGCQLEIRLINKRRRMADEGICKSKRDKLNKLDVIGEDKKLLECFLAIVKELAIKYGL